MAALLSSMVDPMHSGARSPVRVIQETPMVEGKNDTNEFVSHVMLSSGPEAQGNANAVVRVSLLGAGFVCGVGGRNISAIQHRTGVAITSSVSKAWVGGVRYAMLSVSLPLSMAVCRCVAVGPWQRLHPWLLWPLSLCLLIHSIHYYLLRVFKVSGGSAKQVKSAVAIMEEAVGVYKSLTEGDFMGQFVEPEVSIQGIMFSYAPPPKDKMPRAACVKELPRSLAMRKGPESPNHQLSQQSSYQSTYQSSHHTSHQSYHSTMDRSSSVDSNESHASLHRDRLDERWNEDRGLNHGYSGGYNDGYNHGYNLQHSNAEYAVKYDTECTAGYAGGSPAGYDGEQQPRHGGRRTGARRPPTRPSMVSMMTRRSLSGDRSRLRQAQDPPSPCNATPSIRSAYSMPSLSETTNVPDPDRADSDDWRQGRGSVVDFSRGPRARSLLNDFQRMTM